MGTKVSAATALLPVNLATGDYVPVDDGVLKQKLDLSLLVTHIRLTGLTVYTTRAAAAAGTSSAAAINTQLSDLSTAGGGIAYLAPGFYALSVALVVPSNVRLVGAGRGISVLVVKAAATTSTIGAGYVAFNGAQNSSIENITLDLLSMTGSGGNGIIFTNDTAVASTLMNYITYGAGGAFTEGEVIVGGTSGATALVVYQNGTTAVSLANVVGTFQSGETITGRLSGTAKTTSSALTNVASKNCAARSCEVIGTPNQNNQYLIWIRTCENIIVDSCLVDGRTVTESGALEFRLDNNSSMDQQGIEPQGCYNVKITNNTVQNVILSGINVATPAAITNHNENVLIQGNTVQACGLGIYLSSDYTSSLPNKLKNIIVKGNNIETCHKYGIRIGSATSGAAEQLSDVIVCDNTIDLRGTKIDATNYGCFPFWVNIGTLTIANNVKILRNVFRGGGGKGSSTTIAFPNIINASHGFEIRGNTFDTNGDSATVTASGGSFRIQSCNDTIFADNTITNPIRLSLEVFSSLRCQISGNTFKQNISRASFSDVSMVQIYSSSHNASFINNVVDSNGSANPSVFGNNTGTGFEYYGNTFVGSTKAFYDTIYPYVAETGTTQTHGFGLYSPANGGASFTITNGKIWKSSKIAMRQTAGTALAFTLSVADGSFVLTPSAVFAGTSTYQWQIIN